MSEKPSHDGMACFVVGHNLLLLGLDHHRLALQTCTPEQPCEHMWGCSVRVGKGGHAHAIGTCYYSFNGLLKVCHLNISCHEPGCDQGSFIADISNVGTYMYIQQSHTYTVASLTHTHARTHACTHARTHTHTHTHVHGHSM